MRRTETHRKTGTRRHYALEDGSRHGSRQGRTEYRTYRPGFWMQAGLAAVYLLCSCVVGWLFFGRLWTGLCLLPGLPVFLKSVYAYLAEKRRKQLVQDFRDALDLLSIALKAGSSVERAFPSVARELNTLKGKKAPITKEFRWIAGRMELHVPVEELLDDLALRSDSEDIRNFAGVFSAAKRMGGSMTEVVRSAADVIGGKIDVEKEIRSSLAAKKHEQLIMTVMPCGILLYMKTASPGFLDVMYTSVLGICVMAAALAVYAAAALWGRKIVDIEV